ncbi:hypothetical protein B0H19DRAFT_1134824 [Mycena capillaripes]|nr:hypothetical protein B0H19DRAFT_1134824 [Mycena capillaripes]
MASSAANRVPDELVSEILTPLLKHLDEEFLDQSKKPLLDPGFSSSTYLLVCKAWLRVSTPLLYNVVILRTTPQAEALHAALESSKELGLFIKKLRVEGGFGNAMHTILRCAPNITDVFLTLHIGGTDSVRGLCDGLPLVNPRRVIVVDHNQADWEQRPKKNKKVTDLLETLLTLIQKWDKLQTFHFPYEAPGGPTGDPTTDLRANALASALAKSKSLETVVVRVGGGGCFPEYFRQLAYAPSLKSLCFTAGQRPFWAQSTGLHWELKNIEDAIKDDPQLKAIVTYGRDLKRDEDKMRRLGDDSNAETDRDLFDDSDDDWNDTKSVSGPIVSLAGEGGKRLDIGLDEHGNFFCPAESYAYADTLPALKKIGETIGGTVKKLTLSLMKKPDKKVATVDPTFLTPFTSLTFLACAIERSFSFSTPGPGFSALPQLEQLNAGGETPDFLEFMGQLPLNCLRRVLITGAVHVPAAVAFVQSHGTKLELLEVALEILIEADVFDLCTSLGTLRVSPSHSIVSKGEEFKVLPDNFFSCAVPHGSLSKIHFSFTTVTRSHTIAGRRNDVIAARTIFEQLDPDSFPTLKEIQIDDIKWPTSEQEARKDAWVPLSEVLHGKGIKLINAAGVGGVTGVRAKVSTHRR